MSEDTLLRLLQQHERERPHAEAVRAPGQPPLVRRETWQAVRARRWKSPRTRRLTRGGLRVEQVSAAHAGLLDEPTVGALAGRIEALLAGFDEEPA